MLRVTRLAATILAAWLVVGMNAVDATGAEIHDAARAGDLSKVRALIGQDASLANAKDGEGRTPLHWAALGVHVDVMRVLIEYGADVNAADANAIVPLHSVATRNHAESVALLIQKGARVDVPTYGKHTALHLAAQSGAAKAVAVLVKNKAALESKDDYGRTPLVLGARERDGPEVARILIEAGADGNAVDRFGSTALELAAWRGCRDVVDVLLDHNVALPARADTRRRILSSCAERGLGRLFKAMMALGGTVDVSAKNGNGGSLLHDAAAGGSTEIVTSLIERKLDANATDRYGWTPAHYAARDGRVDVLKVLLHKGSDPNRRTLMGQSPLNVAEEYGFASIRTLLAEAKADPSPIRFPVLSGDYLGQTPPGRTPQLFAVGIVSSIWGLHPDARIGKHPDRQEVLWPS